MNNQITILTECYTTLKEIYISYVRNITLLSKGIKMSILHNIENKNNRAVQFRAYTEHERNLSNEWLKTNKPKKVGLNISIYEYSKIVDKKQSKLGADNRSRSAD